MRRSSTGKAVLLIVLIAAMIMGACSRDEQAMGLMGAGVTNLDRLQLDGTTDPVLDLTGNCIDLDDDGDTSICADTDNQVDLEIGAADEFVFTATIFDVKANKIDLDADADTSITADTDDQIDFEVSGADEIVIKAWATTVTTDTTTHLFEIQETAPVFTAGTNIHAMLNLDLGIGNSTAGTNSVYGILIDDISQDAQQTETAIDIAGTGWDVGIGVGGNKIDLDADDDTSIVASTDDQIDVEISGANDFQFTANTFTAVSGSTIKANTIAETTATNGVAIDGLTVKDGGLVAQDQAKTADYSVATTDNGDLFTNAGASAEITFTLPSAVEGLNYCFYVYENYTVTLELDGSDQFHHITDSAGDRAQNVGTVGDSICWQAVDATYWLPLAETGTWSDAD